MSGQNTLQPLINAPGLYILEIMDAANFCSAVDSVQVFDDANAPFAEAGNPDTLTCAVNQLTLSGNASVGPDFTYQWTPVGAGNIVSGQNSLNPEIDQSGIYELLVTNQANGCTSVSQVEVSIDTIAPVPVLAVMDTLDCVTAQIVLSGAVQNPGQPLSWQWNGQGLVSGGDGTSPIVNEAGWYSVQIENTYNNCQSTDSILVEIDTLSPIISIASPDVLNCIHLEEVLDASVIVPGSYSAIWNTVNGNIVSDTFSLNPVVDSPGTYFLTVTNTQNGCTAADTVQIDQDIIPPTALATVQDTLDCLVSQLDVDGGLSSQGPEYVYNWTVGNGGVLIGGQGTLLAIAGAPGTYTLEVTNTDNGCTDTFEATVTENFEVPLVDTGLADTLTCANDSILLVTNVWGFSPVIDIQWSTLDGNILSGFNNENAWVNQPGLYTIIATDPANGCSETVSVNVPENVIDPIADAGPAQILHCNQPDVPLQGAGSGGQNLLYSWSTISGAILWGEDAPDPQVGAPGTYMLTVTNSGNGCTAEDQVEVTEVLPPEFEFTLTQPSCPDPYGIIEITPGTSGLAPYAYSINDGQSFQSSPSFFGLQAADYQLVIIDQYGCTSEQSALLEDPVEPELILPEWVPIEFGDSTLLTPLATIPSHQVASWTWTPAEGLSCTDCEQPWAKPFRTTLYRLEIVDLNGCTDEAQVTVVVSKNRQVYAPNIFSPNEDGQNDRFTLFGRAVQVISFLEIFDRWGNKVYRGEQLEINNTSMGWDGTFNGEPLNPGVFVWQAVVVFIDGEEVVLSGDVTIYR